MADWFAQLLVELGLKRPRAEARRPPGGSMDAHGAGVAPPPAERNGARLR